MKIIVYHWYIGMIWFDGIFDTEEEALEWIRIKGSSDRRYQYESCNYFPDEHK